ncbi:Threonine synthase [bioreactor metagenome]|uniref:Threonine synthase n=1 Tax=bioreactor metagenome TaxID=1076179 RepID=A0A645DQS6_9ZZZZ
MQFYCSTCGKHYPIAGLEYRCECGGLFKLEKVQGEEVSKLVSLGEVTTPLLKRNLNNMDLYLKLDYMMPTGSYKDRGAFALINKLKELGITEVVEDSSGNAGAAIAGYCAAAGIKCNIYLPDSTSAGKIKQATAYRAAVVKVPGNREDTAKAIKKAAETTYYASHVYNPLFFEGTRSMAYELYEQIGIPDYVVIPAGNGTMLLGAFIGFKELGKLPKIIAVQSENCDPIYRKFKKLPSHQYTGTAAEGIAIQEPMRIDEIIEAVRESGGDIVTVTDDEVKTAQAMLGKRGTYVEVTSGAALAGALKYFKDGYNSEMKIVVPLTGSGLKK